MSKTLSRISIAITLIFMSCDVAMSQWQVHTPPEIAAGIFIDGADQVSSGGTILLRPGQQVGLSAAVIDLDRKPNGSGGFDVQPDDGKVLWTKTGGTLSLTSTTNNQTTTYTAPNDVGSYTVTAQADDKPTLADDNPGGTRTITVKVVDGCPTTAAIASTCVATGPDWTRLLTAGHRVNKVSVSGGTPPNPPNNWNGLVVREVVNNPVVKAPCAVADFNEAPANICNGSSSWVVGGGATGISPAQFFSTPCVIAQADNSFWDTYLTLSNTKLYLKAGKGPCDLWCDQEFFCKDTSLGKFTIKSTFTLISGGTRCSRDISN